MLEEVLGQKLQSVERLAWDSEGDPPPDLQVGSVHLGFGGGRVAHFDTSADWELKWSVTGPGDEAWLGQYLYNEHGRWVIRDASTEEPFSAFVGKALTSVTPDLDEMGTVVGATLHFGMKTIRLQAWNGEIDTSPRY